MLEVALVTCARLPELDDDDRLLLEPLASWECRVTPAVWDDPAVEWDRFDLSVIRSTWDYTDRRDLFVAWARATPRLLNPAVVVAWNTDKRYLADLAAAGLPVVPTTWIASHDAIELPLSGEYVLKPSIGAGSLDADRFDLGDANEHARAIAHVERLLAAGLSVMVQPFAHAIEQAGETGVILVDGQLSHGTRKGPMLGQKTLDEIDGLHKEEAIEARMPSDAEIELARAAMAAVPMGSEPLLYARVDMVPGADGRPMIMELELTEPSLFMVTAPLTAHRFAQAIATRARLMAALRK